MNRENDERDRLSRRNFIAGATGAALATAGAAVGLAGCSTPAASADGSEKDFWLPDTWDYEADVVCTGYGGSGATAALFADDKGSSVICLEKAPSEGGGSTRMSGGFLFWASDADQGAKHLVALSGNTTPYEVAKAYCDQAMGFNDWVASFGIELSGVSDTPSPENPNVPYGDAIRGGNVPGMGKVLWEAIDQEVKARDGIQVLFDCTAHDLIQNPKTKEIIGVKATLAGKEINVKAKKAVALTTGGFMYNDEMLSNFLRIYPFVSYGWRYNTGDGIKMAQKVGAALWHTNFVIGRGTAWFADLEPAVAGFIGGTPGRPNYIFVDKYGKRYGNEKGLPSHSALLNMGDYDARKSEYTRIPIYLIFDETVRGAGSGLCMQAGGCDLPVSLGGDYRWSADNLAEIERGWIKKSDTVEGLAELLNQPSKSYEKFDITPVVDAENLKKAVERYNAACAAGVDDEFGTDPRYLAPIDNPPYYAMPLWPGCSDNPGGARRNEKGQIVDPDYNPIPRLYGAGANGAITGLLYVRNGAFLSDALIFGQIIGNNMADETPWDE
jgi:succinate dehydrogenase/fumarate reductase flavoprotein subunit